jgi:parallel beta-helix repeat protein
MTKEVVMKHKFAQFALFSVSILIAVGAFFVFTGQVSAQDEPQPVSEPATLVEPVPAAEPAEQPPAEQLDLTVDSEDEPAAEHPQDQTDEPELPVQDPVVVDETGQPVSLASQAAVEADPYFTCADDSVDGTVDGICRYFGLNGIQTAVADFTARMGSGHIFIEDAGLATDYTGAITISGIPGLTGLVGTSLLTPSPSSLITLNGTIDISNQLTGFTLSGLTILGNQGGALVNIGNNVGTLTLNDLVIKNPHASGDALNISSNTSNVVLTEVKADQNGDDGASIETTGNVTVTNSSFDNNSGLDALVINATGSVALNGVSASNNASGNGARIYALKGVTVRNSLFNGNYDGILGNSVGDGLHIIAGTLGAVVIENSGFNSNQETGLYIYNNGSVSLKNIEVRGNQTTGVYIDNCASAGTCTYSASPVTVNTATIIGGKDTLYILSNGNITLTNVKTNYSSIGYGAHLQNDIATSAKNVTVNNSDFSYSNNSGLYIRSKGSVTLNKVTSNYSSNGKGFDINLASGTGTATISNTLGGNETLWNNMEGLYVISKGSISVTGISAYGNGLNNIYLDSTLGKGSITLVSAESNGSGSTDGLVINSGGAITLKSVTSANNNFGKGAVLNNAGTISPANISITTGTFSSNHGLGVQINTRGSVVINGIVASSNTNSSTGAVINTTFGNGNVSISNGEFNNNSYHGLTISSLGTITLNKIEAIYNPQAGVGVDNSLAAPPGKAVTINGIDVSSNSLRGLTVLSLGSVTITNIYADSIPGGTDAAKIDTLGSVTISTTGSFTNEFNYNFNNGLTINTNGSVMLKNLSAAGNVNGYGVSVNNVSGSGNVTIVNANIDYNGTSGLTVISKGTITGTGLHASNNQDYGANLSNNAGGGGVTINGGTATNPNTFNYNKNDGLSILTNGSVSLLNVEALYNNNLAGLGDGIDVNSSAGNISLTNIWANGNGAQGVTVITGLGTISLSNVTTNSNRTYGTYLDNSSATDKSVTIKNFTSNSSQLNSGLYITSTGAVSITTMEVTGTALLNAVYVFNLGGSVPSNITISSPILKGNQISNNQGYGVLLYSDGSVSFSNFSVEYNYYEGINVDASAGSGSISFNNGSASHNRLGGIRIYGAGSITAAGLTVYNNGNTGSFGWGATLDNTPGTGKISVSKSTFTSNYHGGLFASSNGAITVTNSSAEYNAHDQGFLLITPASVSILSTGGFKNLATSNYDENVKITSGGDVVIQNLKTQYNSAGPGVSINNTTGSGKVTISGIDIRSSNNGGLNIASNGAVSIINGIVYGNNGTGTHIDNSTGAGVVTIINLESSDSTLYGLTIITNGNTTLDKVKTLSNSFGTSVQIGSPTATLTVSRSVFDGNSNGGFGAILSGNVTLNNVSASNNTGAGAMGMYINNWTGAGTVTILSTYGGNFFNNNAHEGIYVFSTGAFKGSNITANDNGYHGLDVFNQLGSSGFTLTGGNFYRNSRSGINVSTSADAVISGVNVVGNGTGGDHPGIYVTNNGNITISNSVVTGNAKEGIYAQSGSPATILISKTFFFGNERWNPYDVGSNIKAINGTLKIIR